MLSYNLKINQDAQVNVDRQNGIIRDCILLGTLFNYNEDFTFSETNQSELVTLIDSKSNIGNDRTYSYLGHAKQGSTSDDRLPFRLGSWVNPRIDGAWVLNRY